ncbi:GNAT family N-acetyltransferase [Paenibacillus cucumis (ex Kampfer et al. 2016)]|uniref:GNAT family N-acetyltransferase n=1 Tax=Paenibacillus cucumis (ex Kampfer et al. 2016) TaxID=1776858 RepID=A0ABS7KRK6_9BACL|nr:GNAT family N-acetyltransferase [Paenibacillus cucumis (ex Kampfer et al. 2016)]MBY0206798.1 GNAT family N-acetyltransferase [Paenibacillus cucumis (ex Kampfer et al. 2016)]
MDHNYMFSLGEVTLTPICESDIEVMRGWRNDPLNQPAFLTSSYIHAEQQKLWFYSYLAKADDIMFIVNFGVESPGRVGMAGLYNINKLQGKAEFGRLLIGESFARGKGLGIIVTRMICEFGFKELNLNEICLEVLNNNSSAKNVYIKVGFIETDRFISEGKDIIRMSLFKENLNEFN